MSIDQASYAAIQPELLSGETILWAGQPDTAVLFHKEDLFLIPFSLFWGGFAIFWVIMALGIWGRNSEAQGSGLLLPLFGVPFVVIGQYLIWGRFLVAGWKKRRTYYAVSNRRVIVVQNGWSRKMASSYVDSLPLLAVENGRRGIGTLRFTESRPVWSWSQMQTREGLSLTGWDGMSVDDVPVFRDIEDVDSVYRLVSQQRESLRQVGR